MSGGIVLEAMRQVPVAALEGPSGDGCDARRRDRRAFDARTCSSARRAGARRVHGAVVPAVQAIEPFLDDLERRARGPDPARASSTSTTNLATPGRYGVLSLPTVIVFAGGRSSRRSTARSRGGATPRRSPGSSPRERWPTTCSPASRSSTAAVEAGQAGRTTPLPADLQPAVAGALAARRRDGPLRPPGRDVGGGRPRRARRRHDGHGLRQVARVHAPGPRRDRARAGDAARSTSTRRRRSRRTRRAGSRASGSAGSSPRSTTATRRSSGARTSAGARTRSSRTPTCSTSASSRITTAGGRAPQPPRRRRRRGARVPRRVRLARRRTSFGASAASPLAYGAEPQFVLASATIANAGRARRAPHRPRRACRRHRHVAAGRPRDRALEPGARSTRSSARARARSATRRGSSPTLVARGLQTICFAKSRKAAELVHRFASDRVDAATARAARAVPGRATRRSSGARSSGGSSRASCWASRRPTRSSSGSTSARSTARSRSASPARSRRCASSGGAPGGARRGLAVLVASEDGARPVLHARAGGAARAPGRGGDPRPREPADPRRRTCSRPRTKGRSRTADADDRSGRRRSRGRPCCPSWSATAAGFVWRGRDYPAARVSLRSGDTEAFVDRRRGDRGRARHCRARARVLDRPRGRRLPPPRRAVPRVTRSTSRPGRRSSEPVDGRLVHAGAEGDRDRRSSSRSGSRRWRASSSTSGASRSREQVVAYQRKAIADGTSIDTTPLDLPETTFETEGVWFSPGDRPARRASTRCRRSSRRSMPPSTR